MPTRVLYYAVLAATTLALCISCPAQQLPKMELTTLDGVRVILPKEAGLTPLVLLLSFSHRGADDVAAWNKQFKVPYTNDQRIDFYELSDFQGVPQFVMKMILHGMRRSIKEPERSHSAPFYTQGENWKSLVTFDDPKIAYLLLADGSGHVVWQTQGPANQTKAVALEAAIVKLVSH
jgi:hypothetical protein